MTELFQRACLGDSRYWRFLTSSSVIYTSFARCWGWSTAEITISFWRRSFVIWRSKIENGCSWLGRVVFRRCAWMGTMWLDCASDHLNHNNPKGSWNAASVHACSRGLWAYHRPSPSRSKLQWRRLVMRRATECPIHAPTSTALHDICMNFQH